MRSVLLVCATVLVLAGCAGPPTPAAAPSSRATTAAPTSATPAGLTGAHAFGDPTTVDMCGLVDPASLPPRADRSITSLDADNAAQTLGQCSFEVAVGGGRVALVVGPVRVARPNNMGASVPLSQGVQLATTPDSPGSCTEDLLFADHLALTMYDNGPAGVDLCPALTAVARATAARILAGQVRHLSFPPHSYAQVFPCDLLATPDLDALSLQAPNRFDLSRHYCNWYGTLAITVNFAVGPPVPADRVQPIAGRPTVEYRDILSSSCILETGGPSVGAGQTQIAEVRAAPWDSQPATSKQTCATARAIAAVVWPKLPA